MKRLAIFLSLLIPVSLCAQNKPIKNVYEARLESLCLGDESREGRGIEALKDANLLFEIKRKGADTDNPVDEFIEFLRAYCADRGKFYFLVSTRDNRYGILKRTLEFESSGKIFSFFFRDKDSYKFILEVYDPQSFLNSLINSQRWNQSTHGSFYTLEKGEKIFFIANGKVPKIQMDILYNGMHASTYFISEVPLYGNTFFIRNKSDSIDFALNENELEDSERVKDLFNDILAYDEAGEHHLSSFVRFINQPTAKFNQQFDVMEVKFKLWDEGTDEGTDRSYYSINLSRP